jgi:hypothetical protein
VRASRCSSTEAPTAISWRSHDPLTSSATGDVPSITVKLKLTKLGNSKLKSKGKVAAKAKITFTPGGGTAATQTKKLKIKGKKKH